MNEVLAKLKKEYIEAGRANNKRNKELFEKIEAINELDEEAKTNIYLKRILATLSNVNDELDHDRKIRERGHSTDARTYLELADKKRWLMSIIGLE